MAETRQFYIQDSRGFTGNSVIWWRPNGEGYTNDLDEAWMVDEDLASEICRCRASDKMWSCNEIDAKAQRHFDMQRLKEIEEVSRG